MTTTIQSPSTNHHVVITPTATRVTPTPAQPFKSVLNQGAGAVVQGAQAAVQKLPGGQLLAAAVRQPAGSPAAVAAASPTGATGLSVSSMDATGGSNNMSDVLNQQAENSMYYLGLQVEIQQETQRFSTVSNVLKARHDTVKNAINNVR